MKIKLIDAHDRFKHFTTQEFDIGKTCQDMIDQRPFGDVPFYIFAHKREIGMDERTSLYSQDFQQSLSLGTQRRYWTLADVPTHRIIWQPRLTKPKAQTNSMLFKAYPGSDNIKVIWIIPQEELWEQYAKGKLTENKIVVESIHAFRTDKEKLEAKEEDDLSDQEIDAIYTDISLSKRRPEFTKLHS